VPTRVHIHFSFQQSNISLVFLSNCAIGTETVATRTGFGICKAWGDPHYMTLDGSGWFDFMGTCTYVMARTHRLHQSDPRWFSVMATNEHRGRNKRVSYLQSITINLRGGEDVIKLEKNRVIRVGFVAKQPSLRGRSVIL